MWPALQRSMSSLQMPTHQLRNQSAKPQQLPEEQARACSPNTKFKQRLQHLFPQQSVSASDCRNSHSDLLSQMLGKRNEMSLYGVWIVISKLHEFFSLLCIPLFWNILRAPDLGAEELNALSAQNAFISLVKTFNTRLPYMLEYDKIHQCAQAAQLLMKPFDTYP